MQNDAVVADPLIGKIISERYRVLERVGSGGFGAVYRVQHIRLDKTLALKVLFEHSNQNPRMIKRFEREARATCRIGHDNIVEITDFARDRRVGYYFVMEFLAGETLADRLRKLGPMSASRIIHVACQIADALAATHAKGIVHRDLKPDNIFLVRKRNEEDFVKILDFGIAAMGDLDETVPRLTRHGTMLGTPAYMSPEQAEGKPPDHRSDIYSLGIILYELATGQVPYRNAASMAVLEMHRSMDPVPPRQARPDLNISAALERVVLRALRKQVAQRYQSMREVYNDLVNLSQQIDMTEVRRDARRPRVTVDGPPTPAPDDIEPEEPEWLDEDLVLLEDDDDELEATRRLQAPYEPGQVPVSGSVALDYDPTRVESSDWGESETAAMVIGDADILESVVTDEVHPDDLARITEPLNHVEAGAPRTERPRRDEPKWSRAPGPSTRGPSAKRDQPARLTRNERTPERRPTPAPTSTGPSRGGQPERRTTRAPGATSRKTPLWQRPPVLMAAGFAITLGLYGLFSAILASSDTAKTGTAAQNEGSVADTRPVEPPASEAAPEIREPALVQENGAIGDEHRRPEPSEEPKVAERFAEPVAENAAPVAENAAPVAENAAPLPEPTERREAADESTRRPAGPSTQAPSLVFARSGEANEAGRDRALPETDFSTVELTLESNPPGATVFRGKEKLGVTPFTVLLERTAPSTKLRFELKGYAKRTKNVKLNGDKTVVVKLRKPQAYRPSRGGTGGNGYEIY